MKILFVSADKIPHIGGKSSHVLGLISAFKEKGYSCDTFCCSDIPTSGRFFYRRIFIKIIRLLIGKRFLLFWRSYVKLVMSKILLKLQIREKYDMISCQDAISGNCMSLIRSWYPELHITITMHTYFALECTLDGGVSKDSKLFKKIFLFEENCLSYADSVVAVDDRIRKHLNESINSKAFNIKLFSIQNFTNTSVFSPDKNYIIKQMLRQKYALNETDFVGVCIRRLVEKNGVFYAAKAFSYIKDENIKLLIVGAGPE